MSVMCWAHSHAMKCPPTVKVVEGVAVAAGIFKGEAPVLDPVVHHPSCGVLVEAATLQNNRAHQGSCMSVTGKLGVVMLTLLCVPDVAFVAGRADCARRSQVMI